MAKGGLAMLDADDVVALEAQRIAEALAQVAVVLDDENVRAVGHRLAAQLA